MRKKGLMAGALLVLVLTLPALGLGQTKAMLWDGAHWQNLPQETKVAYVKGIGNLADFEMAASKRRAGPVCKALDEQWKNKSITSIVQEVDKFYQENPQKMNMPVIEVMLRCCKGLGIP